VRYECGWIAKSLLSSHPSEHHSACLPALLDFGSSTPIAYLKMEIFGKVILPQLDGPEMFLGSSAACCPLNKEQGSSVIHIPQSPPSLQLEDSNFTFFPAFY